MAWGGRVEAGALCFVLFCFDMLTGDCEVCGDEWVYFAAWWEAEAHG